MKQRFMFAVVGFLAALMLLTIYRMVFAQGPQAKDPAVNPDSLPLANHLPLATRPSPTPTPLPAYDWTVESTEALILSAGELSLRPVTSGYPDQPLKPHLVRFEVKSTSGVDAGVLDDQLAENAVNWFGSGLTLCYTPNTLQSDHICRLVGANTRGSIVLRDPRPTGTKAAMGLVAGAILGVKEPAHKLAVDNRVTLTLYGWQCVRNCPGTAPR